MRRYPSGHIYYTIDIGILVFITYGSIDNYYYCLNTMLIVIRCTIDKRKYATVMLLNLMCHSPNNGRICLLAPVTNVGTHCLMAHYVNNTIP